MWISKTGLNRKEIPFVVDWIIGLFAKLADFC
jgi:hypothetical protein